MPSSLLCKPKHILLWETIVVVEAAAEAVALQDAANLKRQHFENEGGREVSFFLFGIKVSQVSANVQRLWPNL
jgi:hypothetical protein